MHKLERLTSGTRQYLGEPIGSQLASWLNREWPGPPTKEPPPSRGAVIRVARMVELLQKAMPKVGEYPLEPYRELSRTLKPYRFRLQLWLRLQGKPPLRRPVFFPNYILAGRNLDDEGGAIWRLFELGQIGLHHRLLRCQWCKRWLYARFSSQVFCSPKCRKTRRERSEPYKAYRREYARGLYWEHKVRNHRKAQRRSRR